MKFSIIPTIFCVVFGALATWFLSPYKDSGKFMSIGYLALPICFIGIGLFIANRVNSKPNTEYQTTMPNNGDGTYWIAFVSGIAASVITSFLC